MINAELVDISKRFPQLSVDLKYASADNFTGQPIYSHPQCLLHVDAAEALEKSIEIARVAGFQILILDAYRPQKAQEILWQANPDQDYVAPLDRGSHHSRGTALDVTLVDVASGDIVEMGTGFDEMNVFSHPYYPGVAVEAQRNRLLLNAIMYGGGFTGIATEWWHFELPDSDNYPLLDDVFDCLSQVQPEKAWP